MNKEENIINRSLAFRGAIIHEVSTFERLMDLYLANYFCKSEETVTEFITLILGNNRISLNVKRKIMDNVFVKDKIQVYNGFNTDMNTLLFERNNFAHCTLAFGKDALDKSETHVGLIRIGMNTHVEWYDQPKVSGIIKDIRRCSEFLKKIVGE